MSWIQQQTGPPLQQQQYPPTTTSLSAVAAGVVPQNSTANFVQNQWQQHPQQQQQLQQQYYLNQQQQNSMQQQQPGSNQNNWFNPTLNAVPQQQAQNNWQQQQLVPPPPAQSNSEYFTKQHQHQQHPPQLDNFMSIETQQNSSHYQSIPPHPLQPTLPNAPPLQQPNLSGIIQNNFLNTERETMSTNSQQQHFETLDNHQQQKPPEGNSNNNDNWDNEWEWNDNNPQSQHQLKTIKHLQKADNFNTNIIEESFKSEPNDNWQWNIEEPKNISIQPSAPSKELKNNVVATSLDVNVNENRRQSVENPQNFNQVPGYGEISHNFQSLPIDVTVLNSDNSQNSASNSNVFVSQAKPVSQPPRQFAIPPATSSGSIEKITTMQMTTMNSNIISHPISSQSPGLTNVPPPPAAQTPPQSGALPPPPPLLAQNKTASGNPFKRAGLPQHHRATGILSSAQPSTVMSTHQSQQNQHEAATPTKLFFAPPPPEGFQNVQSSSVLSMYPGNQEILSPDNSEIIMADRQLENLEIAPSNDRNQYLQTSHLSEEDFTAPHTHSTRIDGIGAQNNDNDNFPPPGLSRLVLGQPEIDNPNSNIGEIPPGLDRMIPGTELVSSSSLNLERQADGQDTIPSPRSAFTNVPPVELNNASSNIDITADRNLYLVPGESEHREQQQQQQPQTQRVVTGVDNDTLLTQQSSGEQRELELDGENLEDVQQSQINNKNFNQNEIDFSTRDEPLEGANTSDILTISNQIQNSNNSNETESSLTIETHPKELSNPSTANDESDHRSHFIKSTSRRAAGIDDKVKKRGNSGNKENIDKRKERYESEESDISLEQERRRHIREGSIRNDRGDKDNRESREKDRRVKREGSNGNNRDGDKDERRRYARDDKERYTARDSKRVDRDRRERVNEKYDKNGRRYGSRYETDSKYETETSRYERNRKDGSDRERERERDRYDDQRRDDKERRRYRKTGDADRHADERRDRRRGGERNDYREERSDRHRTRNDKNRIDYDEEYRKSGSGSRNARDSDREKDRSARTEKDSRYSQMYGYPTGYNYDAYAYYQQQQKYYEELRRTNPQAYSEWYRKYYGAQAQSTDLGLTATDGRESVHSGRSSANNDKDRYSLHHQQQYIPHHPSDYHRHFFQQSNMSSTPNVTMNIEHQQHQQPTFHLDLNNGYGSSSSGNLLQQQQYQLNHLHGGIGGYLGGSSTGGRIRSYYAQSEYSESRPENLSLNLIGDGASLVNQEPQRLTPFKYTNDHSTVSFSAGLLICVKPKYSQNGITNIVKILRLGSNDSTRRLFQTFPGPLIRGLTHKKTIIEYCEDQIRLGPPTAIRSRQNSMSSLTSTNQMNKASFTLMWNLLILLLRQNGMVVGTDIAELLIKNKNQFPYEFTSNMSPATKSSSLQLRQNDSSNLIDNIATESDSTRKDKILNSNVDSNDGDSLNSNDDQQADIDVNTKITLSEQEITEKFRNYLLYGNVNEALEWATDNNLWGHALFLASKVDRRSHANVMMKFANKLQLNDPLQTLYQLMSGRTPSSVTSVQDEKWGDWRPHLAMILSNTSQRPDLDRKSITTLGDSLYNRGDLFAAQFCYLMAQVGFGKYSAVNPNETTFISSSHNNAVRLILLGSSHHKMFKEFATNEAIMMTEIYEYACSLNDDKFSIVEFQPYKYLLATRMLDYGHQLKTLMYMEQIALHIQRDPSKYEPTFIEKIFTLADRLKYYDPVTEKTMDDQNQNIGNDFPEGGDVNQQSIEDQKWLQDLRIILNEYKTDDVFEANSNNLPIYQQQISASGIVDNRNIDTSIEKNRAAIDQQFVEINQQFSKLTMQYNNFDPMQQSSQQDHQIGDENQVNNLPQQQGQINNTQPQQFSQFYNPNEVNVGQIQIMTNDGNNYGDGKGVYSENNYIQSQQHSQGFEQQDSLSIATGPSSQGNYEYWDQSQQLAQNEVPRPTISLPNSNSGKSVGYYGNDDNGQNKNEDTQQTGSGGAQHKGNKNDNKNTNKSGNISSASQNSGWFGGIWNKLSLKPKNQMILPDDKNPAIVWDSEKKKWVNTDGDDNGQESFKPPPKMGDALPVSVPTMQPPSLNNYNPGGEQNMNIPQHQEQQLAQPIYGQTMQQQQQIPLMAGQQIQPQIHDLTQNYNPINNTAPGNNGLPVNNSSAGEPTTKTPNLQSNMFKMQRNRTLKNSYVDVFNPSGAPSKPAETVLAPVIPSTIPQSGFFIPTPVSVDRQQQQQQPHDGGPQFYNPNQFGGYQQ